MLTSRFHETIRSIDPAAWDALGADPLGTHAVHAALEEAAPIGVRLRWVTLSDRTARMVAGACFAEIPIDGARLTHGLFRRLIGGARRLVPGLLKTRLLVCGTPLSVGGPAFRIGQGAHSGDVVRELGGLLREHARERGIPWAVFKELDDAGDAAGRALDASRWIVVPSEDGWTLELPETDWNGYLASLRSHYRYRIVRDETAARDAGIECERMPLAAWEPRWHPLYEEVNDRAEIALEKLNAEFFRVLGRAIGADGTLLHFRRDGRAVGFVVLVRHGGDLFDLFHGIDGACNAEVPLYFAQLAETIRFALATGARRLHLGQSCGQVKSRFGAVPSPRWIALGHESRLVHGALSFARGRLFPPPARPSRRVFRGGSRPEVAS